MRLRSLCFAALFLVSGFFSARASQFAVYELSGDNAVNLIGINASGVALVEYTSNGCTASNPFDVCYREFTNGAVTYSADTLPTDFAADNGTACAPPNTGISASGRSVCNNGFQVWGTALPIDVFEIYPGSAPFGDAVLLGASADVLRLNGSGDFLVDDGLNDAIYQVVLQPTPEPGTLALFATGAFGLLGAARRRVRT